MKYLKLLLIVIVICFTSCYDATLSTVRKLKIGMTKEEVVELLGKPRQIEIRSDEEMWWYRYENGRFYNTTWLLISIKNEKVDSFL